MSPAYDNNAHPQQRKTFESVQLRLQTAWRESDLNQSELMGLFDDLAHQCRVPAVMRDGVPELQPVTPHDRAHATHALDAFYYVLCRMELCHRWHREFIASQSPVVMEVLQTLGRLRDACPTEESPGLDALRLRLRPYGAVLKVAPESFGLCIPPCLGVASRADLLHTTELNMRQILAALLRFEAGLPAVQRV